MPIGDHIKVKRNLMMGISSYYHHGIDLGDGNVIHFTGEPSSGCKVEGAEVRITDMASFLAGGTIEVVKYSAANTPEDTIAIAKSFLGATDYSLFSNNCEHFARYCKTCDKKSEQVKDIAATAGAGVGAVVTSQAAIGAVAASGAVSGVSGAGVMSGLASIGGVVGGGVATGIVAVAAAPAVVSNVAAHCLFEDDEKLSSEEREARKAGRIGTAVASVASVGGAIATVSATGSVAGLSAAGITSGLAAIGSTVGGGMAAGVAITAAAPAVVALALGYGVYKWFQKN